VPKVGGTKDPDLVRLRELAPTHVLVNVDENRAETAAALREFVPHVVVTHPCAPADNLALVAQMAGLFAHLPGVSSRAQALQEAVSTELAACTRHSGPTQRVLYLIWRRPWMTVARDTYLSRMLALAGLATWPDADGGEHGAARYPVLAGDEPWLAQIEHVLLSSEPYRFGPAHAAEALALCPNARVHRVDGELLSWYGPRAVAGLRYARALGNALATGQNAPPWNSSR
jgi:hypothetical protein